MTSFCWEKIPFLSNVCQVLSVPASGARASLQQLLKYGTDISRNLAWLHDNGQAAHAMCPVRMVFPSIKALARYLHLHHTLVAVLMSDSQNLDSKRPRHDTQNKVAWKAKTIIARTFARQRSVNVMLGLLSCRLLIMMLCHVQPPIRMLGAGKHMDGFGGQGHAWLVYFFRAPQHSAADDLTPLGLASHSTGKSQHRYILQTSHTFMI